MESKNIVDPFCIVHGKKMSEHRCLYCCLCFKSLTVEECHLLPSGKREDVCNDCAEQEERWKRGNLIKSWKKTHFNMTKPLTFEFGDITDKIWIGDIICRCKFVKNLTHGRMIFKEVGRDLYRLVFWEVYEDEWLLNGWTCAKTIEELMKL